MAKVVYALVDCNNFYASCERVFDPKLDGKPVAVLSNNDGCAIAASNEAKAMGVTIGMPWFEVRRLSKSYNKEIICVSSNFALYEDFSIRVKKVLSQFTPRIENYSIDESFLDITEFTLKNMTDYGKEIRQRVLQWTGIPVSVGIGPTKTLAKIANKMAKKHKKLGGALDVTQYDERDIDRILHHVDVGSVWGVGRAHSRRLNDIGVTTAKHLKYMDLEWVQKKMTIVGVKMVRELRGEACIDFDDVVDPKKGIASTRTFGHYIERQEELIEAVSMYAGRAAEKLRSQNSVARRVTVFVNTNFYDSRYPVYSNVHTKKLVVPSSDTSVLVRAAQEVLRQIYLPGYMYNKAGVILTEIMPEDRAPLDLFEGIHPNIKRRRMALMKTVDEVNKKWGRGTVHLAAQGVDNVWKMKRNLLTPRYTTQWLELPIVKAR